MPSITKKLARKRKQNGGNRANNTQAKENSSSVDGLANVLQGTSVSDASGETSGAAKKPNKNSSKAIETSSNKDDNSIPGKSTEDEASNKNVLSSDGPSNSRVSLEDTDYAFFEIDLSSYSFDNFEEEGEDGVKLIVIDLDG